MEGPFILLKGEDMLYPQYDLHEKLRTAMAEWGAWAGGEARKTALTTMARLIAPFTPHLAEEAWARLGEDGMVLDAPWPVFDAALAADDEVTLPVQIGGKRRGEVVLPRGSDNATVEAAALANPTVQAYLAANNLSVRKVIVVPDRIVNLVAG